MPDEIKHPAKEIEDINAQLPNAGKGTIDSFNVTDGEGFNEELVDAIEMIGEEKAAGFEPARSQITPGMRYLHSSRTIHQLVTDRNRAVGIYLAVASLLLTASGALYEAGLAGSLLTMSCVAGGSPRSCARSSAANLASRAATASGAMRLKPLA